MDRIPGFKFSQLGDEAQASVPARYASVQRIRDELEKAQLKNQYSIRLRADVYRVTVEGEHALQLRNLCCAHS